MKVKDFVEFHRSSYSVKEESGNLVVKVFTYKDISNAGLSMSATGGERRFRSDNKQVIGQILREGDTLVYLRSKKGRSKKQFCVASFKDMGGNYVIPAPTDFLILRAKGRQNQLKLFHFLRSREGFFSAKEILEMEMPGVEWLSEKFDPLILQIQALSQEAAKQNRFKTMHALNKALQIAGWEYAETLDPEQAEIGDRYMKARKAREG